jgi:hypothetical protein
MSIELSNRHWSWRESLNPKGYCQLLRESLPKWNLLSLFLIRAELDADENEDQVQQNAYKVGTDVTSPANRPYSELGKILDGLARRHNVRGPYSIAQLVSEVAGYEITGQAISRYFYGEIRPKSAFIAAFADTIELTREERDALAWFYTYGSHLDGSSELFDGPS